MNAHICSRVMPRPTIVVRCSTRSFSSPRPAGPIVEVVDAVGPVGFIATVGASGSGRFRNRASQKK
jgi:hypothetical protein